MFFHINNLYHFLLNFDSIILKHNTYDGLQEIDPPGVIPDTLEMYFDYSTHLVNEMGKLHVEGPRETTMSLT